MIKKVCIQFLLALSFMQANGQIDSIEVEYVARDPVQQDFRLFTDDDILEISLTFDVREYMKRRSKDEYMNAVLTYYLNDKDYITKEIRLKSRGEFRHDFCSLPPIKLNFKKTEFDNPELNNLVSLKLVTHCNALNSDYVLREFLIYKLFNVLTDQSFRVRLLRINYISTDKKAKVIESYAFIIEPLDFLAERSKAAPVTLQNLTQRNIIPEFMDRMAIFNYMIGNTDWSVPGQHNCKVLMPSNIGNNNLGMIVPYDFDYSGLVNANYAVPYEPLGLESVRERKYQGMCRSEEILLDELQEFIEKKDEFYSTINDFPYLKNGAKKDMINYLNSFYKGFDKRNSIVNQLMESCKDL